MVKARASFAAAPSARPSAAPRPARPAAPGWRLATSSSPSDRTHEGPEQHTGHAEEEAEQGAGGSARDAGSRGAEALRAERTRGEVDEEGEAAERSDADQRIHADLLEAFGPGGEHQARQQERRAGDPGQEQPREADQHQQYGECEPEQLVHDAAAYPQRFGAKHTTLIATAIRRVSRFR